MAILHFVAGLAGETSGGGRGQVVLVVDDEPDIRDAVRALLEHGIRGTRVLTAASGSAGLEVLRREAVDLIVTDYKMPGMNGVEFLNQARQIRPRAPRILITAFDRELADELGPKAQVETVFTKPLDPRSLVTTCQKILARQPA